LSDAACQSRQHRSMSLLLSGPSRLAVVTALVAT
jgi:hypothetical protein